MAQREHRPGANGKNGRADARRSSPPVRRLHERSGLEAAAASSAVERERALRQEMDVIFAAIADPILVYDREARVARANEAAKATIGVDPVGMSLAELAARLSARQPNGEPLKTEELPSARALRGMKTVQRRLVIRSPGGQDLAIVASATPLKRDGAVVGAVTVWHDISERDRLLAELEAVFHALPDLYFRLDAQGRYLDIRAGRPADLYAPPDKLLGRLVREVLPQAVASRFEAIVHDVLETGSPATVEYVLALPQGDQCFEARVMPFSRDQVVVVARNVTERKRVEQQREEFVRMVSHDLRQPLTVVQGYTQQLQRIFDREGLNGRKRRMLDAIAHSAARLAGMIRDLVDAARLEGGQIELNAELLDLRAFTAGLVERMEATGEEERIALQIPPDLPPVSADAEKLERVLGNLLGNALRYSDPGTTVTVRAERKGDEVVISIADRGPGIPPEELSQLFQPYRRRKTRRLTGKEGLGLGLCIAKGLVEAHGGRIWAESTVGVGSTFFFTLPVGPLGIEPRSTD